jgi:hypothetical protein
VKNGGNHKKPKRKGEKKGRKKGTVNSHRPDYMQGALGSDIHLICSTKNPK